MENKYIIASRAKLLSSLCERNISRKIDKMGLYKDYEYILLDAAKVASKDSNYKKPKSFITCRIYVTSKPGMYGHQFLAAVWVNVDGQYHQASGSGLTGGCGYDKVSTAVDDAFRSLGLGSDMAKNFGGTGEHEKVLDELAGILAGRKAWFKV